MTRSPQETLKAHIEAVENSDLNGLMADYADDAVILTPDGVMQAMPKSKRSSLVLCK